MKGGSWAAAVAKGLRREGEEDDLMMKLQEEVGTEEKNLYRKVQMNRVPLPTSWFDSRTSWTELAAGLFRYKQHINLSEMEALMLAVRIITRLPEAQDSKILGLCDSQVVVDLNKPVEISIQHEVQTFSK